MSEDKMGRRFQSPRTPREGYAGLRTPRLPRWTGPKRQIELAAGKTLAFGQLEGLELLLAAAVHLARSSYSSDTHFDTIQPRKPTSRSQNG